MGRHQRKLLFFCFISFIFWFWQSFWLRCSQYLDFYDISSSNIHTFRGVVTKATYIPDSDDVDYCESLESSERVWLHSFSFDVKEIYKWNIRDEITLTRSVWSVHCTRWWSCDDLIIWEEYVVTTNGEILDWWLCWDCPYMLADQYITSESRYNPAKDITCVEYFDGCNTCTKSEEGISLCTLMYCEKEVWEAYCISYEDPSVTCDRWYSGRVCWTDWVTYADYCELVAAWVEKIWDWACWNSQSPYSLSDIPDTCVNRYDWCNECSVEDGTITWCTERACIRQDVPRCMDHDFFYLGDGHLAIIKWYVTDFTGSFVWWDYPNAVTIVKKRIATKIKELHNLMTLEESIVSITKLQTYEFLLEALYAVDSMIY